MIIPNFLFQKFFGEPFECETIQKLLKIVQKPSTTAEISREFKQLMLKGNINAALNLLTN